MWRLLLPFPLLILNVITNDITNATIRRFQGTLLFRSTVPDATLL